MTKPEPTGQPRPRGQPDAAPAVPESTAPARAGEHLGTVQAAPEMLPSVARIERYVRERRDTDRPLIGWAIYFFLLLPVTFGVYGIVVFYQRLQRVDLFSERRQHYYEAVDRFTTEFADRTGQLDEVHDQIDDLDAFVKERFTYVHKAINAGVSVALSFLTLGIYGLISYYKVMNYWWEIQVTEQDYCDQLSQIWAKLGLTRYPITLEPMQQLRRSFWASFFLTLVTLGIYGIIWDYQLHTDPDRVYPEFHSTEDSVLNAARTVHR